MKRERDKARRKEKDSWRRWREEKQRENRERCCSVLSEWWRCANILLLLPRCFYPQEAEDEALQALPAEPRTQTDGELEEHHDHEGREHERDRHTRTQGHSKSLSSTCSALDIDVQPVWNGVHYVGHLYGELWILSHLLVNVCRVQKHCCTLCSALVQRVGIWTLMDVYCTR